MGQGGRFVRWTLAWSLSFLLVLMALAASPVQAAPDFDQTISDHRDDVVDSEGHHNRTVSTQDIDLVAVTSSEEALGQRIELTLVVAGVIVGDDWHQYAWLVVSDSTLIALFLFNNTIISSEDTIYVAQGVGTPTLSVTVPLRDLGDPQDSFRIEASAQLDSDDQTFLDIAPEDGFFGSLKPREIKSLYITAPTDGATVWDLSLVHGINIDPYGVATVELRIDGGEWTSAATDDQWKTWVWALDLANLPPGRHTIDARAETDQEQLFDSIAIFTYPEAPASPPSMDLAPLHAGDRWDYRFDISAAALSGVPQSSMSGSMVRTVINQSSVETPAGTFEAWEVKSTLVFSLDSPFYSYDSLQTQTQYLTLGTQDIISEQTLNTHSSKSSDYTSTTTSNTSSTYLPPSQGLQDPLVVGVVWQDSTLVHSIDNSTYSDEEGWGPDIYEYNETISTRFEVLRTEHVTVPAGSFDAIVIRASQVLDDPDDDLPPDASLVGPYLELYYSAQAGGLVLTKFYDVERRFMASLELTQVQRTADPEPFVPPPLIQPQFGGEVIVALLLGVMLLVVGIAVTRRRRARSGTNLDEVEEAEVIEVVELDEDGHELSIAHTQAPLLPLPPMAEPSPELAQTRRERRRRKKEATHLVVAPAAGQERQAGPMVQLQKRCPACGTIFEVLKGQGPVQVTCPSCGSSGIVR